MSCAYSAPFCVGDREARAEIIVAGVRQAERVADLVHQGVQPVQALVELEVARLARGNPHVTRNSGNARTVEFA